MTSMKHFIGVFVIALTISLCLSAWFFNYATDPKPGHQYVKHVNCDRSFKVTDRTGDVVTFVDEQSGETKTMTVAEFKKQ